ncbi:glycosyl hydrolase [Lutibacter sp.]|uniref:WD40/YVTN/BNR-like repeat-containing protein n=1 Tax=Lutibacter sp. TaxID=1925666 RepID=UPI001A19B193|nr:glycosyl hydrolase [Lutibacter sp.]MBI9042626.1 glycosyl hydrolase [Lutibacter sp.]
MKKYLFLICCFFFLSVHKVNAQKIVTKFSEEFYKSIQWRNIGPFRGGRSAAVTGVSDKANLYYFGSTGGGVWKTTDAGNTWSNISDGFFGGSVGAIAVSESDNNVIYVGNGEVTVRGNVSSGDGMWKSVDAGKTWKHIGLEKSRHIPRVRVHPKNSDIVFAAVLGDLYKSSEERGIYKSVDGGKNWKKVLFSNSDAGAVDLIINPTNPRILYASTWNVRRTPYSLSSGGDGSAIWKSTDEGENWVNISTNEGLPKGIWGISGIAVSPLNSDIIWALIENNDGGVYKSLDAGKTWKLVNSDRALRQRAWYYTRIYADTQDENTVYVVNVSYHQSKDGGTTFKSFNAPHGDHHDLWIAPEDNQRMIIADDGGAQISFDAGENWSTMMNQPTAQFYRVVTDNYFPYRIYGAQQDNSTVRISHRTNSGTISESDWQSTAGGESAHITVDPLNNDIVYGGSYGGLLTRVNHKTDESRVINVWPDDPMGHGAEDMKYRFQWNYPIFFSPHNKKKLYTASNHLHVTYNEGQSFEVISPDLTRNDPKTLGVSGGPITKDNTGVEYYGTIFAAVESPFEENLIWTGSDDGLVHITKDGGKNWENVTPKKMPEWMLINCIEVDPFIAGGAYIVGTRYKMGDYAPYIYKTEDYGKSWKLLINGMASEHFTRALRSDPNRKGLLYAGTENGMYITFDDGLNWSPFQLNLPIVPITDLTIKNNNLIAATQGRSFWLIDDLTPLHQINTEIISKEAFLYKPMDSYRMGGSSRMSKTAGQNHPGGVLINYYVKNVSEKDTISLAFFEADGKHIKTFSTNPDEDQNEEKLKVEKGSNVFNWDMQYPDAEKIKGMILWWASLNGPKALPGNYKVKLSVNEEIVSEQQFTLLKDPRSSATDNDLQKQFNFIIEIQEKLTEIHKTLKNITIVKTQIEQLKKSISDKEKNKEIIEFADTIVKNLTTYENELYQTKSKSNQDPLNFPIKLNNKLAHLNSLSSIGDFKPTDQSVEFKNEITKLIDVELSKIYDIFENDVKSLNKKVRESDIELINLD